MNLVVIKLISVATVILLGIGSVEWELTHKKDSRYVALMALYFAVMAVIVLASALRSEL